ncbi:LytTR family DNA-binding domain-containing protein [Horticoccus luteus]|uniref:LytTR family DNA-binding domain-containing protein n=1 Tax=Horticoccus luteus TaxID=2862869 RepID=A0A8F9TVE1_9BACT|nr:LytTR family DNA-binding domain-containing protein [Horticoccus luteus]QYM78696.1 LytTR family DNA-binding domain-containing protein [Horticoccus luteus]
MPRALLIEDEAAARADLRTRLAAHPEVVVVAEAGTLRTAGELLARPDYDLVFLDIQLVGGNSFALVPLVRAGARIVFTTAHDAYALRAFEINALDYLLKPIAPARLAETLRRLEALTPAADDAATEEMPRRALTIDDTVYLRAGLRARFAPVAQISLIGARANYSEVQLVDGAKVFLRKSLKAWEDILPGSHFMRVHRTQIVNLAQVTRYERDGDEHTLLHVAGAREPVPASRDRWSELRERLGALRLQP